MVVPRVRWVLTMPPDPRVGEGTPSYPDKEFHFTTVYSAATTRGFVAHLLGGSGGGAGRRYTFVMNGANHRMDGNSQHHFWFARLAEPLRAAEGPPAHGRKPGEHFEGQDALR
jgi:hypothetical protein